MQLEESIATGMYPDSFQELHREQSELPGQRKYGLVRFNEIRYSTYIECRKFYREKFGTMVTGCHVCSLPTYCSVLHVKHFFCCGSREKYPVLLAERYVLNSLDYI